MIDTLYIEEELLEHSRTKEFCERYKDSRKVYCKRYSEIFNRKAQNFRLQKQHPSLILGRKHKGWVLPCPEGYGIGGKNNFYFSHMLNCIYDCRYCFLQGMYRSGHYLVFVNFEDFQQAIIEKYSAYPEEDVYFFSGYDCDSLAMEPITHFLKTFIPFFRQHPRAILELRTKSVQIRTLLEEHPFKNCVVAFSLMPEKMSRAIEHRTPSIARRLQAMKRLQDHGWTIGIRLDPVIYSPALKSEYQALFEKTFSILDPQKIHSVSLGSFRLPKSIHERMIRLYPKEKMLSLGIVERENTRSYPLDIEQEMMSDCLNLLSQYVDSSVVFQCPI